MAQRKGRRKKVNFNPNQEFLNNAKREFIKNGGRITKIEDQFDIIPFIKPYRSDSAMGMDSLPVEFIF